VTNAEQLKKQDAAASRAAAVPPVGAARPGNFWQRWKEWERTHGTVPTAAHERAA
jgi:hypothetical protein